MTRSILNFLFSHPSKKQFCRNFLNSFDRVTHLQSRLPSIVIECENLYAISDFTFLKFPAEHNGGEIQAGARSVAKLGSSASAKFLSREARPINSLNLGLISTTGENSVGKGVGKDNRLALRDQHTRAFSRSVEQRASRNISSSSHEKPYLYRQEGQKGQSWGALVGLGFFAKIFSFLI